MPLHFHRDEYAARVARASSAIAARGLDAMLLFAPESHYWLTGYDTFGFAMFQCMVLGADGEIHLLTRAPDQRQARFTSTLPDDHIHIWIDREGMNPGDDLRDLLASLGLLGKRFGVETDTVGLTARNWDMLRAALPGENLQDASDLIRDLRRVKSPAEIACHRRAAELADDALDAGLAETRAGAFEGDILAAMQGAVFKGGGDYAGNEFILGSGEGALLCRYYSGRRHLDPASRPCFETPPTPQTSQLRRPTTGPFQLLPNREAFSPWGRNVQNHDPSRWSPRHPFGHSSSVVGEDTGRRSRRN